jgi:hypothetical protein
VPFLLLPSGPLLKQTVVALLVEMVVSLMEPVVEKLLVTMGNTVEVMERLRLDPVILEIRWCTSEIKKFL